MQINFWFYEISRKTSPSKILLENLHNGHCRDAIAPARRPGNLIEVKDPKIKGRNASGINLNEIGKRRGARSWESLGSIENAL